MVIQLPSPWPQPHKLDANARPRAEKLPTSTEIEVEVTGYIVDVKRSSGYDVSVAYELVCTVIFDF